MKHGHGRRGKQSPEYNAWHDMKKRCSNPNCNVYPRYGGRGITYDPRWEQFENFLEDMGPRPDGMTLERKDNDGNYCKANCRWASRREQFRNRSSTRMITHNGHTLCGKDWADKLGLHKTTIYGRLKRGYSIERALEAR